MKRTLFIAAVVVLSSCASRVGSGAGDAHRDISAGHIQLKEAGTIGVYTPGVKYGDHQFDHVPRHGLPSGCTNQRAVYYVRYAETYNAVMIGYIAKHEMITQ